MLVRDAAGGVKGATLHITGAEAICPVPGEQAAFARVNREVVAADRGCSCRGGSNVFHTAALAQGLPFRAMAVMMVRRFPAPAVMAIVTGFPAFCRRLRRALSGGSQHEAMKPAIHSAHRTPARPAPDAAVPRDRSLAQACGAGPAQRAIVRWSIWPSPADRR